MPTATSVQSAVSEAITALTERRNRSDLLKVLLILTEPGAVSASTVFVLTLFSHREKDGDEGGSRDSRQTLTLTLSQREREKYYIAPAVLLVTRQTIRRAIAFTTKVTRKRIKPSSISELR